MIYFRNRKYGSMLDSSFFFRDGPNLGRLDRFMVGDFVSVMFPVNKEKYDAMDDLDRRVIGPDLHLVSSFGPTTEYYAHIPCTVVRRSHAISWHTMGEMRDYGLSIVLEADTGYAEDLLLWIMLGERPPWASDEAEHE